MDSSLSAPLSKAREMWAPQLVSEWRLVGTKLTPAQGRALRLPIAAPAHAGPGGAPPSQRLLPPRCKSVQGTGWSEVSPIPPSLLPSARVRGRLPYRGVFNGQVGCVGGLLCPAVCPAWRVSAQQASGFICSMGAGPERAIPGHKPGNWWQEGTTFPLPAALFQKEEGSGTGDQWHS